MEQKAYKFGIVASLLVLLVGYVGSYLMMTDGTVLPFGVIWRKCSYEWMTIAYRPLASIEGRITGTEVMLISPDEHLPMFLFSY